MSPAPLRPIPASSDGDTAGSARAMAACLRGAPRPPGGATGPDGFLPWTIDSFPSVVVPHLLRVRAAAAAGDFRAILEADRAFAGADPFPEAGRLWSASRAGLAGPPLLARFAAAASRLETPARFDTVLAVRAASFHIAAIPMLQASLFARWAAGRPDIRPEDAIEAFLRDAAPALAAIPAHLASHDVPRPVAVAAGR